MSKEKAKEGIYFSGNAIASLEVVRLNESTLLRVRLNQLTEGRNVQMYQTFKEGSVDFDATFLQFRKMMLNPGGSGIICMFDEFKKRFEFLYS